MNLFNKNILASVQNLENILNPSRSLSEQAPPASAENNNPNKTIVLKSTTPILPYSKAFCTGKVKDSKILHVKLL